MKINCVIQSYIKNAYKIKEMNIYINKMLNTRPDPERLHNGSYGVFSSLEIKEVADESILIEFEPQPSAESKYTTIELITHATSIIKSVSSSLVCDEIKFTAEFSENDVGISFTDKNKLKFVIKVDYELPLIHKELYKPNLMVLTGSLYGFDPEKGLSSILDDSNILNVLVSDNDTARFFRTSHYNDEDRLSSKDEDDLSSYGLIFRNVKCGDDKISIYTSDTSKLWDSYIEIYSNIKYDGEYMSTPLQRDLNCKLEVTVYHDVIINPNRTELSDRHISTKDLLDNVKHYANAKNLKYVLCHLDERPGQIDKLQSIFKGYDIVSVARKFKNVYNIIDNSKI